MINAMIKFIRSRPFTIPIFIFLLVSASHIQHFNKGPRGVHVWRQCNTLSVARNFFQEDMNILKPRVDHRKGTDGVTGSAFPAYEYALALQYKVFGYSQSGHRYLQLFFTACLIFGGFYLGKKLFSDSISAGIVAWILAWSPELYYHGINALPDISALALSAWALYFYFKFKKYTELKWMYLVLFAIGISLAGLVKLQYLMFGGVAIIDSLISRRKTWVLPTTISTFAAALPSLFWYMHAVNLRKTTGLVDYGLFVNPADTFSEALTILWSNVSSDFPELLLGYAAIPIFVAGIYAFWKYQKPEVKRKALLIGIGLLVFHVIELDQMKDHGYYMMPYILFMALICGYGFQPILQRKPILIRILLLLLLVQPILTFARINHRYMEDAKAQMPVEFLKSSALDSLKATLNKSNRVLIHGDPSGCIFFYYLDCKGWCNSGDEEINLQALTEFIQANQPEHLIIYKSQHDSAVISRFGPVRRIGNFQLVDPAFNSE